MAIIAILYCTTLFSNQRTTRAAESTAWQKGTSWNEHRFNISSPVELPVWGSFRPGIYFGMKTRTPIAMSTGILWATTREGRNNFRHDTHQDQLTQFEWVRHDGKHYGQQNLIDKSYNMLINTTFLVTPPLPPAAAEASLNHRKIETKIVPKIGMDNTTWVQRIDVKSIDRKRDVRKSLLFYLGFEGAEGGDKKDKKEQRKENKKEQDDFISDISIIGLPQRLRFIAPSTPNTANAVNTANTVKAVSGSGSGDEKKRVQDVYLVTIVGRTNVSGWFRLVLTVTSSKTTKKEIVEDNLVDISYVGMNIGDVSNGVSEVQESLQSLLYQRGNNVFSSNGHLTNEIDGDSSFITVQIKSDYNFVLDSVFYGNLEVQGPEELRELAMKEMVEYSDILIANDNKKKNNNNDGNGTNNDEDKQNQSDSKIFDTVQIDRWINYYEGKFNRKFELLYGLSSKNNEKNGDNDRMLLENSVDKEDSNDNNDLGMKHENNAIDSDNANRHLEADENKENNNRMFSKNDIEAGKRVLSSLLGGIGYFYGSPRMGNALDLLPVRYPRTTQEERDAAERYYQEAEGAIARSAAETVRGSPIGMLTGTPSRTSFPRGFLWDEGFHQLVVSRWDASISMQILSDWLNAMYHCTADKNENIISKSFFSWGKAEKKVINPNTLGGWIPREMILGKDAEKRVPDQFVTQRVDIANPPTLMLVVESLLDMLANNQNDKNDKKKNNHNNNNNNNDENDSAENNADRSIDGDNINENGKLSDEDESQLLIFLNDIYPALDEWITWFLNSQKGPGKAGETGGVGGTKDSDEESPAEDSEGLGSPGTEGSFRWRGRSTDEKKLIANTLSSGLDDYPRSPIPSIEEHHLDLFCWMAKSTGIMARLEKVLESHYYSSNSINNSDNSDNSDNRENNDSNGGVGGISGSDDDFGGGITGDIDDKDEKNEKRNVRSGNKDNNGVVQHVFTDKYSVLSEHLLTRLDPLHWSEEHRAYLDVGYSHDHAKIITEVIARCGNPTERTAVEVAVSPELARSGKNFCPEAYPQFVGAMQNAEGGMKTRQRFAAPESLLIKHIPRIGYVTLFPFLLQLIPMDDKFRSVLDVIESPDLLWSDHGLRSLSKNDTFYKVSNEPGDDPYWSAPLICNVPLISQRRSRYRSDKNLFNTLIDSLFITCNFHRPGRIMLAPRKKLWSTPSEVIEIAIQLLAITTTDVVYDIGAGDCRFLLQCRKVSGATCIGVEIDEERAQEARIKISESGYDGSQCLIITGNALEQDYSNATHVFLYLVPRGLKLMLPILENIPRKIRVVTYMSPFPPSAFVKEIVKVGTSKHADAQWPLFVYDLNSHLT